MAWKRNVGVILLLIGTIVTCVPFVTGMFSLGILSVQVVDTVGDGIDGATIYVFEDNLGLPEDAIFSGVTNVDGTVSISNTTGLLGVAVIAEGYTSDRAIVVNPEMESEVSYAYYGACGVVDYTHTIVLDGEGVSDDVDVDVDPDTIELDVPFFVDPDEPTIAKPLPVVVEPLPLTAIIGVPLALVGCAFLAYDPVKDRYFD